MGQVEVLEYLKEMKKDHPTKWWSRKEIIVGLCSRGCSNGQVKMISADLHKLSIFGQIDAKGVGIIDHKVLFRAKE